MPRAISVSSDPHHRCLDIALFCTFLPWRHTYLHDTPPTYTHKYTNTHTAHTHSTHTHTHMHTASTINHKHTYYIQYLTFCGSINLSRSMSAASYCCWFPAFSPLMAVCAPTIRRSTASSPRLPSTLHHYLMALLQRINSTSLLF